MVFLIGWRTVIEAMYIYRGDPLFPFSYNVIYIFAQTKYWKKKNIQKSEAHITSTQHTVVHIKRIPIYLFEIYMTAHKDQ